MRKIYADRARIFLDNWNAAYGNKILHLLFLINLCGKHGREPVMYAGSNLENIFDFNMRLLGKTDAGCDAEFIYEEKDPFSKNNRFYTLLGLKNLVAERDLTAILTKYFLNHLEQRHLLERGSLPDEDCMIKGHFFDSALMPDLHTFSTFLTPKKQLVGSILEKYKTLTDGRSISVHLRGTDFSQHARSIFPRGIALDDHYYHQAILEVENRRGKDVEYHLFSDEMPRLEKIFAGKRCIIHDDTAPVDWIALFLSKNVIQSNSSFCWTASLYNKDLSIQPAGGYNYHDAVGSVPFGFAHNGAILIDSERTAAPTHHRYSEDARIRKAGIVERLAGVTRPAVRSLAKAVKRTLRK